MKNVKRNRKVLTGILIFIGGIFTGFGIALWIGRSIQQYDEKKEEFRKQALNDADREKKEYFDQVKMNHNIDGPNKTHTTTNNTLTVTISKPGKNDVVQQFLHVDDVVEFIQKSKEEESDE